MRRPGRLWWHRGRAIVWVGIGAAAFPLGWQDAIWLLWLASVYANVESAWATGQAADDREIIARLDRIEASLGAKG